jgi:large subunit ribosomal protein L18
MSNTQQKQARRLRRKRHVRRKVFGTAEAPRLAVFRSLQHVYGQVINDETGVTLVSASSLTPEIRAAAAGGNCAAAKEVGKLLGKRATEKGIEKVVFDRAGYKYHGRVKAVADGAREAGLKF